MPNFFNAAGGTTVNGTTLQDTFFLFTYDADLDHILADAVLPSLSWSTAILLANGSQFTFNAANIQVSFDLVLGGDKSDIIYGSNLSDAIFYNNGSFGSGFGGFQSIEQFFLGNGDDFLDMTAHGAGGVDYGKDTTVNAGTGNDTVIGGAGKDTIDGDAGDDVLFGYRGADTINGGTGNDVLYGDDLGFNNISGDDILRGQAGNDILYGGARADTLEGGDDNDTLYGDAGSDNLAGNNGTDVLYGGDSVDLMDGDAGDDRLIGGAGNDDVDGGADVDTAVFSGNRADYAITPNANGSFTVTDIRAGSPDGIDIVRNMEFFEFADGTIPAGELNTPPTITSNGGGDTANISINENTAAVTTVTATDPDAGQTLTYSILGGLDAAKFVIDAQTGIIAFVAAPDFENPLDSDGDNVYYVVVRVSDGNGGFDTQTLSVTVTDVVDGSAPVITSNGGGASAAISISENTTAITTVVATDPDSPTITYRIAGGADAALFGINATTGELYFLAAPDFENPLDAGGNNVYNVTVEAFDGNNSDTQALSVTIDNVNDNAPVITSNGGGASASVSIAENTTAVTTVAATDADGTTPTYRIAGGADASLFGINAATGELYFLAAPDFENPLDAGANNIHDVIVEAFDGVNTDSQAIAVTVGNVNDNAPVITSNGGGATANISIAENSTAVTTVAATDADGTTPNYRIAGGADAALFGINATTGELYFLEGPDFEHPRDSGANNIYDLIVEATDGVNIDSQAIAVTVTDVSDNGKTITGSSGNNTITPTATNVAFQTTVFDDTIFGLGGNDIIDGGLGADAMDGGTGNDTFYVDRYSEDGFIFNDDRVIELAGGGIDTVNASVSYRLASEVENLNLIGIAAINGSGNVLNNAISGNGAANTLSGGDGNDNLSGGAGADTLNGELGNDTLLGGTENDTLSGGDGNDSLDGGADADTMTGGAGNDTYSVNVYSDDGNDLNDDFVVEVSGGGTDAVNASVSYRLAAEVENLTLTGTASINGTGNVLNNTIKGNSGANILLGGDGNDNLRGNAGADTIDGESGNDTLLGGSENDILIGGAGNDRLEGGTETDSLDGGIGADTLLGQAGIDSLTGGTGKDTMTGGTEADTFVFANGDTAFNGTASDIITDFVTQSDKIDLAVVPGNLPAAAYAETSIATALYSDALAAANAQMAPGKTAVFVAGTVDGWLFWDTNGDSVLDQVVVLKTLTNLASFDSTDIL
jgi:Ca2+-binding RTX toxin-like protein